MIFPEHISNDLRCAGINDTNTLLGKNYTELNKILRRRGQSTKELLDTMDMNGYGEWAAARIAEMESATTEQSAENAIDTPKPAISKPKASVRPSAGRIIKFAGTVWIVLAVENGKALLISKKILEKRVYHTEPDEVTWKDCALRGYLNGEFYNRFSDKAKAAVAETHVTTPANPWYDTRGGSDTTDKIFLLSLNEIAKYFGNSGALAQKQGRHISYFYAKNGKCVQINKPDLSEWCQFGDQYNSARIACDKAGKPGRWWLRGSGDSESHAAYVFYNGTVDVGGADVNTECHGTDYYGVRPALWLNL
jgi:hypothetical protein